jgi:hypothetical protein
MAFQSDPRRPALDKIGRILKARFDLSKSIAARAAERRAFGPLNPYRFLSSLQFKQYS